MTFAQRCGLDTPARQEAVEQALRRIRLHDLDLVRVAWCDQHGQLRSKALRPHAVAQAFADGVGMVSTLTLKDTSDRTAFKVFERGGVSSMPGFECASNLLLVPDPDSLVVLPWAPRSAWLLGQLWMQDGRAVELDTRRVLQQALGRLLERGMDLVCGLEIEFHVYRIQNDTLAPGEAAWPGPAPEVSLIHPGYNLLSDAWFDRCEPVMNIVRDTALGLGLPLRSLEIELGPSQIEAVFDATSAMKAADNMVLFRNGVTQALHRAGYHATFMCRPPFPQIMSSGWHLHQSLVDLNGRPLFMREQAAPGSTPLEAEHTLSSLGCHYLAGLLSHAQGMAVFCTPTANGYGRFQPNALAPQSALWGRDNRGAMLRVVGGAGERATRIENRLGDPSANPYLYFASQIHAGLDGIDRGLWPPLATESPYDPLDTQAPHRLPTSLESALQALSDDKALIQAFGSGFIDYLVHIKRQELTRRAQAVDIAEFDAREYFGR
jgi:glutamine synthetase